MCTFSVVAALSLVVALVSKFYPSVVLSSIIIIIVIIIAVIIGIVIGVLVITLSVLLILLSISFVGFGMNLPLSMSNIRIGITNYPVGKPIIVLLEQSHQQLRRE